MIMSRVSPFWPIRLLSHWPLDSSLPLQSTVSSWSSWKSAWSCLLLLGQTSLTHSDRRISDGWGCWEQEDLLSLYQSNQTHTGLDSVRVVVRQLWADPHTTEQLHRVQANQKPNEKFVFAENTNYHNINIQIHSTIPRQNICVARSYIYSYRVIVVHIFCAVNC